MEEKEKIWLTGFIEAKGSFQFTTKRRYKKTINYYPRFVLYTRIQNVNVLFKISSWLGGGYINLSKTASGRSKEPGLFFRIGQREEIKKLISVLDTCEFQTNKKEEYQLWKEGAILTFSNDYKINYETRKKLEKIMSIIPLEKTKEEIDEYIKIFRQKKPKVEKPTEMTYLTGRHGDASDDEIYDATAGQTNNPPNNKNHTDNPPDDEPFDFGI